MGSDVGHIFTTASQIGITPSCMRWYVRKNRNPDLVCVNVNALKSWEINFAALLLVLDCICVKE